LLEYAEKPAPVPTERITKPEDVQKLIGPFLRKKRQEFFLSITLNGSGQPISIRVITIGLVNHSLVHPRETFRDAILDSATKVIICHNHPGGNPEPSMQDIAITKQLRDAGGIIGIDLLDHIIIAGDQLYSFKECGQL